MKTDILKDPFNQAILQSANIAIITTEQDGTITYMNPYALDMLEYSAEELLHKHSPGIFHDLDEIAEHARALSDMLGYEVKVGFDTFVALARLDKPDENDWTYISKSGRRIPVHLSVTAIYDTNRELLGFMGMAKDITDIKLAQEKEKELNQRYQQLAEAAFEAICLSVDGHIIDVNHQFEDLFLCPRDEALGRELTSFVAPQSIDIVRENIVRGHADIYEAILIDNNGREIHTEICGKSRTVDGKVIRITAARDISERKYFEREIAEKQSALEDLNIRLAHLANTDELTQLPNKRALMKYLERFFDYSQRHQKNLAVLIFDIDHFKMYNDTYGHLEGDRVLQQVADLCMGCLRSSDYVGRFGGEEFVIVLPETDTAQALKTAEKVRINIQDSKQFSHPVTVSIGIACLNEHHKSPKELLHSADMQLYRAKRSGRNRCAF